MTISVSNRVNITLSNPSIIANTSSGLFKKLCIKRNELPAKFIVDGLARVNQIKEDVNRNNKTARQASDYLIGLGGSKSDALKVVDWQINAIETQIKAGDRPNEKTAQDLATYKKIRVAIDTSSNARSTCDFYRGEISERNVEIELKALSTSDDIKRWVNRFIEGKSKNNTAQMVKFFKPYGSKFQVQPYLKLCIKHLQNDIALLKMECSRKMRLNETKAAVIDTQANLKRANGLLKAVKGANWQLEIPRSQPQ